MSAENKKVKPKTYDSELFLNNDKHCDRKVLKNDSCAGANAASTADLALASTDPLSEIVWSPEKGLSLKCADKNSSLFRDVGPTSCMVLSPPQSVTYCNSITDKPIDNVFLKSIAIVDCSKSGNAATTDATTVHRMSDSDVRHSYKADEENIIGSGGNEEKVNTAEKAHNFPDDQDENSTKESEKNAGEQTNIGTDKISEIEGNKLSAISGQVDPRLSDNSLLLTDEPKVIMEQCPSSRKPFNDCIDIGTGKNADGTDDDFHTAVEPITCTPGTNLTSSSRNPLEKLECCAENDLKNVDAEVACAATCGVIVSETKNKFQDNETTLLCDKVLPVLHSPCNSRIRVAKNKGKEKSLSDGDANVRLSMDNDSDSHSSVESCNSARLFSTGKKRRNFQQQLIVGSKRVKNNIEETSGSKSGIKQDSSFKNWISSMVKGLSQSNQDDSNTFDLSLANPDHHKARSDKKLITCKVNQDREPKNSGFKSIFQSMYCPSLKNVGTRTFHQEVEGSEDLEPSNMVHGIDATPITCFPDNNRLAEQHFQSNKFETAKRRYDAGPSQPNIEPLNFYKNQESSENNPMENENCSNLGVSKVKEEISSNSFSTRQNTNNTDNVDSNTPAERKEAENICQRRDNLGSLWITRFAPKLAAPLIISDHLNERDESQVHSNYCSELHDSDKHISHLHSCKIEETGEQPAKDAEISTGFKEDDGNNNRKSKYMFNDLSSSQGFTNSEQMASMFARRFVAIKHIMPTNDEGSARLQNDEAQRVLSGGTIHDGIDQETDQNINLKRKSNDVITFKIECDASFKKHCSSSSKENKFKDNPITSPIRLPERKITNVPEGIYDAVKKLRLSRTDILKWIADHGSISQLDGFFLRLRLGKWEEGLGGTGYHVAYINETDRHSLEQHTRKSVSVKVRGMKCMVESQYISNQDFLEEEIMEWWSTTTEASVEIPSEEDLIAKFKKKQMLGL